MRGHRLFEIFPQHTKATNLSILGGGLKLMTILLCAPAILGTIALIVFGVQAYMTFGMRSVLFLLLEEGEEMIPLLFVLWVGVALCGYFAHALKAKAAQLGETVAAEAE